VTLGQVRHRYLADRIALLLLYRAPSEEEGIQRMEDGSVLLRMGPFSRSLRLNSSRCYDQLLFLKEMGYLAEVDVNYQYGRVKVRVQPPLTQPNK